MFREFSKRRNDDNHQLEVPTRHLKSDLDFEEIPRLSGFDCYLGNLQRNAHRQWIIAGTQSRA